MGRLLVLMGSGETTPTMVTPHQRIVAEAGEGARIILDTPYGFQENADELSARTADYFTRNVGCAVQVVSLRDAATVGPVASRIVADQVADAAWVFAGPGSPSYLARQWLATPLPDALRRRVADGSPDGATVFASAAACTVGRLAIPVYEMYKVGEAPHWREGLDLLRTIGLDVVVVPHYDNTEGGTHDTSCCYIGDRRLRILERDLDPATWILGVDEHTAAVIDLTARTLRVEGRGRVVARVRDHAHAIASGSVIGLDDLLTIVRGFGATTGAVGHRPEPAAVSSASPSAAATAAATGDEHDPFVLAVANGDLVAAADVTATLLDGVDAATVRTRVLTQIATLARIAQAGLHVHRDLVAPFVDLLLALRQSARDERRFAAADAIRDALVAAGVEVRDGDGDTRWEFTDPLEQALADAHGSVDSAR